MGTARRRVNGFLGFVTAFAVGIVLVLPTSAAHAEVTDDLGTVDALASTPWLSPDDFTGLTSDTAAASCWEIKQLHPDSPSGAYWLLTPSMSAPAQFWCDQETDGGGWVKVGQGRQAWETNADGRGVVSTLLTAEPAADVVTTQLSTKTVDELLNGTSVSALADGVRVRRAASTDGSSWQEVRFRITKQTGWFWSMGAGWPLVNWQVGSSSGTGSSSSSFGSGSSTSRVDTSIGTNHNYTWSFSYGNGVTGSSEASSYLWTPTTGQGGARPFSQVYLRPQVLNSESAYPRIADSGTNKVELEVVPQSNPLPNPWGVTGLAGSVQREGDVEVQDMVVIGDTMYVGGNFRYVQQNESGAGRVEQSFLAAFNASTGQYISSFQPRLNEAVLALAATSAGQLAVGGKFTSVNGTAVTGFAVLNPATGAIAGPLPSITNSSSPGVVRVETISAAGGDLYLGGSFTHVAGPTGATAYARNAARITASNMMPVTGWRPEFNGTVLDTDVAADGSKAYFSGFFSRVGTIDTPSVAAVPTASPVTVDAWTPTWSSTGNFYQRAIVRHEDRIYVGGSEHSMFAFDATTYERLTTHITNPKGDFQTLLVAGDFLYGGSHSNAFIYEGATLWPSVGTAWTRADTVSWANAWRLDGASSSVSTFSPVISARLGSGGWATAEAPNGNVWSGGDYQRARVQGGGSAWTGAFVRFIMSDGVAPNAPTNLRTTAVDAGTVRLAWNASSGGLGSGGSYHILRDNRVIATTSATSIVVPLAGEQRYFVRAADATGNLSASTPVLTVPGGNPAPTPDIQHTVDGLAVTFDGSGSTDDGTIVAYHWSFGDGATATGPVATHTYFNAGTYEATLTVVDDRGAWTTMVYEFELTQPRPTDAYGASVYDDQPWAYWRLDELTGTLAADSATGTHFATYQRDVTQGVPGVVPGSLAADFDGSNDVLVGNDLVQGPNTFSAEIWFKTTTTRGGKLIGFGNASSGTSSSYDRHIYMQNDGKLVFGVYSGASFVITSPTAYNDGEWHHAVGTLAPDGMRFYVDGELVGTHTQSVAQDYSGYWRVGGDTTWGSSSAYFDGVLDEAAIYTTALSSSQVWEHFALGLELPNRAPVAAFTHTSDDLTVSFDGTASSDIDGTVVAGRWDFGDGTAPVDGMTATHLYAQTGTYTVTFTVTDDDGETSSISQPVAIVTRPADAYGAVVFDDQPWAYWRLDETGGTTVADASRGGHPGAYRGGVTLGADGIHAVPGAADFDGQNDFAVSDAQIRGPQTFSTELWFNTTTTVGGKLIGFGSSNQGTSSSYDRHVYMRDDGRLVFGVYDGGEYTVTSANSYNDGQWHQVVSTLSSEGMALYIDGQLVGTNAHTRAEDFVGYWRVGGDNTWGSSSAYFDGLIDEVSIYDTALTAAQVANHHAVGIIIPNRAPVAEFSHTADFLTLAVDASASSDIDGTVAQVSWDFGDGSAPVTGAAVTYTYAVGGTYTVTVTVTDDDGDSATLSREIVVTDPPNQAPTATFSHAPTHLSVVFDATESGDADGSIVSWMWDFGDGSPVTDAGATPTHVYPAAGDYTVTLTVTDDDGDVATATQSVHVEEAPNAEPEPEFDFTAAFLSVAFDGTASSDPDGTISAVTWDFGDGSGAVTGDASVLTTTHEYSAAGTYSVVLTITDNAGASASTTRSITVAAPPPNILPTAEFDVTIAFLSVTFDGAASADLDGTVTSWAWDFGDGTPVETNATAAATHTYAQAGTYTVSLTVTDDDGATGSVQKTVIVEEEPVNAAPVAQFAATLGDLSVAVDGSTSDDTDGDIVSWAWDFGDGSPVQTGPSATATHAYVAAGDYTITLTVTDDDGATGSTTRTVTVSAPVNQPPVAAFDFVPAYLNVAFDASESSDADGSIASVSWDFGDGSAAVTGTQVSHSYGAAGSYEVTVTVTDDDGATATATKVVTVEAATEEPATRDILTRGSAWSYWYSAAAPASTWTQLGFDASGWASGAGPIGYGSTQIETNLNPAANTNDRPRAVYFRSAFEVTDASKVVSLDLSVIGDDGVVVYVNGVEVGRKNMRDGAVTHMTFAPSARRVTVAQDDLLTIEIPTNLLVSGTNVIAAETHVNYRGTPDVTFWATGTLTELR